jgi:hypothetical protein
MWNWFVGAVQRVVQPRVAEAQSAVAETDAVMVGAHALAEVRGMVADGCLSLEQGKLIERKLHRIHELDVPARTMVIEVDGKVLERPRPGGREALPPSSA